MSQAESLNVPMDRHYDAEQHLWAYRKGDQQVALVGIDALGLAALGDVAYVALKDVGAQVFRGQPIGTLEAAKMTRSLAAPISGIIQVRNEQVLSDPALISHDPYGEGWLMAINPTSWEQDTAELVSGTAIKDWLVKEVEALESEGPGA